MKLKIALLVILFLLSALSLFGGLGSHSYRSLTELWNLGHIVLFLVLITFFNLYWKKYKQASIPGRFFFVFTLTGILSIVIEIAQHFFKNGTPDLIDVRRNFLGAGIALIFSFKPNNKLFGKFLKIVLILWFVLECIPFTLAMGDEIKSRIEFPILADFESNRELSRWSGNAKFKLSTDYVINEKKSLKINFTTKKYSGIFLKYFPEDWADFDVLKFWIYNLEKDSLYITCRIHDELHENSRQKYDDRFNKKLIIVPGWNELILDLKEIKEAPTTRNMDMHKIENFGIFTVGLHKQKSIYLDYVHLEKF
jgi:VanZ family protein